jgi:type I restriction enzyme M protein
MLTGELRSKIDNVWNAFWAGGIANPLEVIEQITYLLFMRGLDEAHTREENKANRLSKPIERRIFPTGKDKIGKNGGIAYEDMRWSRLKNRDPPRCSKSSPITYSRSCATWPRPTPRMQRT